MSEPAFAHHLFEEVFHDEDVERTDEVEIDHSQFVVVSHDRACPVPVPVTVKSPKLIAVVLNPSLGVTVLTLS